MGALSDVSVPARGRFEREWPAWAVPRAAVDEWVVLTDALAELGRPPACAEAPEVWWSKRPGDVVEAVAGCLSCPVMVACRSYAVAAGERDGTWGALMAQSRRGAFNA